MANKRRLQKVLVMFVIPLMVISTSTPLCATTDPFGQIEAVSEAELETLRGGYSVRNGLDISFGITKVTYIDGVLQSATVLNIPSLRDAALGRMQPVNTAVQPVQAVQTAVQPVQAVQTAVQPVQAVQTAVQRVQAVQTAVQPVQAGVQAAVQPVQAELPNVQPIQAVQTAVQPTQPVQTIVQPVQAVRIVQTAVQPLQSLVQNGIVYNSSELAGLQSRIVNLIQNDLNQKIIDHQTIIDVSVNSLEMYRSLSRAFLIQQQIGLSTIR